MREKDWRKRREELRQYMGGSMSAKPKSTPKSKELFLFRLYVTVILAGGVLLVSLFHSETAEKLTQQVKETIAYEMPLEKIQAAGERLTVFLKEKDVALPALKEDTYGPETEGP